MICTTVPSSRILGRVQRISIACEPLSTTSSDVTDEPSHARTRLAVHATSPSEYQSHSGKYREPVLHTSTNQQRSRRTEILRKIVLSPRAGAGRPMPVATRVICAHYNHTHVERVAASGSPTSKTFTHNFKNRASDLSQDWQRQKCTCLSNDNRIRVKSRRIISANHCDVR